ncbi:ABC transporter ATP-binding protein [Micromonospora sp. KC606]|uniref:ABC transporter ATP-binding protein n=1 Tax=Micromonospora sp. KC606 TaxID=2530379 RepID=UPI00140500FA|nr:ABC transporter ATP-binding protein [Micromonospora sp. KC606]
MRTLTAARELLTMAWRIDRGKLVRSALLLLAGFLATPLIALGLRELTDALLAGRTGWAAWVGVILAGLLLVELMGGHFAHLLYFELGEQSHTHLQQRLFTAANAGVPLSQREQPDYADDLQVAQSRTFEINRALESILQFGGLVVQLAVSTVLIARLHPVLVLVPCLAVFLVMASAWAHREVERAQEHAAEQNRRARHFLELSTAPESMLELRLWGLEAEVTARHAAAWEEATRRLGRGQLRAALGKVVGQLAFAAGYAGALLFVFQQLAEGRATVGDFVMVLALAVQTTMQIITAVSLLGVLQQAGRTIARVEKLSEVRPAEPAPGVEPDREPVADAGPPTDRGIVLRDVSFAYAGADRLVLDRINLTFPAGAVVAVVGENGAGKSTLVKLLCGLYQPTGGRIWFDGRDVTATAGPDRPTTAALFQDFARVELALRDSVGIGAVEGEVIADDRAVTDALHGADIADLPERLPDGLGSVLGSRYAHGAELSGGQWQRVGLARALVRERPALLTLDEPAAALDPMAEHALFERFAAAARAQDAHGAVTVYVSHRFSTVRMADLIVVLADGRVAACGTHEELMRAGGTYAELYSMQARAYASS